MPDHLKARWNDEQVKSLNEFQQCDNWHPYTCGLRDSDGADHLLEATNDGWFCPKCKAAGKEYKQNWCMPFMADWSWKGVLEESPCLKETLKTVTGIE